MTAIDFLKIDTEGVDLDVLKGGQSLLQSGAIPFILAEVGFHPNDDRKVLFDEVRHFLMPFGYHLFGIYDQNLEWTGHMMHSIRECVASAMATPWQRFCHSI